MTTYYRYTKRNNPMSDWGHAMFAAKQYKVEGYGPIGWTLDESDTVDIWDLEDDIREAWAACVESEYFGQLSDIDFWLNYDVDELVDSFDPRDIVDSADAYDHELVGWLWDYVLEPKGIMAVRTFDGAVCFDQSLIKMIALADAA